MSGGEQALHPNQVKLLRVRAALFAIALVPVGLIGDELALFGLGVPYGAVTAVAIAIGLFLFLWMPGRRYRAWAYRMDEDEIRIRSGLMIRASTIVPFARVQHTDIVRGPLQRRYGLASLVLHTAGTRSAATLLPGLEAEEAERMRDHVRARIREDLA